ncbi:MAG: HAD family hydrolase, partial [Chitinispirillaceae bacterium]
MKISNFIFDFDGTLVDSLKDVLDSLTLAFEKCGITVRSLDTRKIIQLQLREAIGTIAPDISAEQTDKVIARFREIYDTINYPNTLLMPTAADLLQKLKERSAGMFIVSNKRQVPTFRILDKFAIRHFFSGIFNSDMYGDGKRTTKSELIAHALEKHSLSANSTAYVGDSEIDVTAAKENGLRTFIVRNGYGDLSGFKAQPDFTVHQIIEILN